MECLTRVALFDTSMIVSWLKSPLQMDPAASSSGSGGGGGAVGGAAAAGGSGGEEDITIPRAAMNKVS